jgi:hypothetical protein
MGLLLGMVYWIVIEVHGKKLWDNVNILAQQSLIPLQPATLGELDISKQRLSQSLYDHYQDGLETISSTHLDFEELERDIHSMY